MIKNIVVYFIFIWLMAGIIISCKHEITRNPSGGQTGPDIPPVTTNNCSPDTAYFQQQVLPIFISNCSVSGCHDAITRQEGVNLTTYSSIMNTGEIRAGRPENSKAWRKITEDDPSDRMPPPPRNPLTQQQKDIIFKWISQGAKNNSCESLSCDSASVTYSGTIRQIISNKCQGCHSSSAPAGGYDFTQYTVLKARVDDGKLWGAINHLTGYSPMPKNGTKLSDCELGLIDKWIQAGAPNN